MSNNIATLITAPIIEPITLGELKLHLRCDDAVFTEDGLLNSIITAGREYVEDITRRHLLTQTWGFSLKEWPKTNTIRVPGGNLQSVTSIKWKGTDGVETTLAETTDYLVEVNGESYGNIILPYGESWPSGSLYPSNPITILFISGWTTAALVPYKIKAACRMICADLYEMRGEPVLGQTVATNRTTQNLLASSRLWSEF